jgi:formate-dependent phosphoribosylglycinamide formyltransferase (GAR transformylase)
MGVALAYAESTDIARKRAKEAAGKINPQPCSAI